jgi:hypothetical protein
MRSGTLVWFQRTHKKPLDASWYASEFWTHSSGIRERQRGSSLKAETSAAKNVMPPG